MMVTTSWSTKKTSPFALTFCFLSISPLKAVCLCSSKIALTCLQAILTCSADPSSLSKKNIQVQIRPALLQPKGSEKSMPQLCGSLGPCLRPGGLAPFIVLKKGNYNVNVSQQESDPGRRSRWEGGGRQGLMESGESLWVNSKLRLGSVSNPKQEKQWRKKKFTTEYGWID